MKHDLRFVLPYYFPYKLHCQMFCEDKYEDEGILIAIRHQKQDRLPLKIKVKGRKDVYIENCYPYSDVKPVLRSMDDLDRPLTIGRETIIPLEVIREQSPYYKVEYSSLYSITDPDINLVSMAVHRRVFEILAKLHFDFMGLLKTGQAVEYKKAEIMRKMRERDSI